MKSTLLSLLFSSFQSIGTLLLSISQSTGILSSYYPTIVGTLLSFFLLYMKSTWYKNKKIQKCQPAARDAAGDQPLPLSSRGVLSCSPESLDMLVSRGVVPDSGLAHPTKKISERKNSKSKNKSKWLQNIALQNTLQNRSTPNTNKLPTASQPTAWDAAGDQPLPLSSKGVKSCSPESLDMLVSRGVVPDSGLACKSESANPTQHISNTIKSQPVSQPTAWDAAGDQPLPLSSKGVWSCSPESLDKLVSRGVVPDSGLACKSVAGNLAQPTSRHSAYKSPQVQVSFLTSVKSLPIYTRVQSQWYKQNPVSQPTAWDAAGDQPLPSPSKGVINCSPESLDMLVSRGVVPDSGLACKLAVANPVKVTLHPSGSRIKYSHNNPVISNVQPTARDAAGDQPLPLPSKGVLSSSPESLDKLVSRGVVPDSGLTTSHSHRVTVLKIHSTRRSWNSKLKIHSPRRGHFRTVTWLLTNKLRNKNTKIINGNIKNNLKITHWNAGNGRWINKRTEIHTIIEDRRPDILFISEANIHIEDDQHNICIPGYNIIPSLSLEVLGYSRMVALVKDRINVTTVTQWMDPEVASVWLKVSKRSGKKTVHLWNL